MKLPRLFLLFLLIAFLGCKSSNPVAKRYTYEDKLVFELIEKLNKTPGDKDAARQLPDAYQAALDKRKEINAQIKDLGLPGDRYMEISQELMVLQQMHDQIRASAAASAAVPDPWNPSDAIARVKLRAAEEYYEAGMTFMGYSTRQYAQMAYDNFEKAAKAYPGFKDVNQMLALAAEKATIRVLVNPVNYYNFGWNYWGFQNDWLQQQMVRDLNARSFRNVRFYTDWELRSRQLVPDRIVDLNFVDLFVDQVHQDSRTYQRSKQIQTGSTKSNPPRPVYETVYATVRVNRKFMSSYATLECRIYDRESNGNILYDRFPDRLDWKQEWATYTGDRRALTNEDWALINNRYDDYAPSRNQIAERLIQNCYQSLISRINTFSSF
ncbi:hypothetical protein KJS94_17735 [Flavihumibacter rivuli]|uniref:hypothetical protein n=1 Tax=Flavihumibacter rivuli TaxID=2838156 RepID=UPI001BDDCB09|nr:hypothetical protein [Flavihumibacter rivuli]ULQ56495.1 hypothetical protein KJS94_17735 [Flavihumibacter rivuli]